MSIRTDVNDALSRFQLTAATSRWADEVGPTVREALKIATPIGRNTPRPGRLRDSTRYARYPEATGLRIEWTAHTPYAPFVIHGTAPHTIRPVAARALHWRDARGSHFAREVRHPGTRPNPYPERVMRALEPAIRESYARTVNGMLGI